jgi:hypothetical protein
MKREDAVIVAAYAIEDIFCQAFPGRWERLKAVQAEIAKLVERISPEAATDIATLRDHRLARAASQSPPIPPSDSAPPPCAVPAGPPAVDRPRVLPEDMPIPQPAPQPPVQNEAAVIQGEDQLAQKEDGVASTSSAGGSSEHHRKADPRNSSRPAGEGPVLIPAGRTKPVVKSKPYDPRPGRIAGVVITAPGKVVAVDVVNFIVACPGGDWQTTRPVVLVMERMRNGEMFGHKVLADLGGMSIDALVLSIPRWTAELAQRGVTFIQVKGVGCRIEIAEASA